MEDVVRSMADTIDEMMAKTTERLEADFSKVDTKISRFPHGMRGIGGGHGSYTAPSVAAVVGQEGSFIEPSVVAIGPYHHGLPHLRKMEEVKLAAAYNFRRSSGRSTAQVYGKLLAVAGAARDCYDAGDPAVTGLSDADLATMMLLDGCFLLQYMVGGDADHALHSRMIRRQILSIGGASLHKDIFLVENQIPWLVLDALTELVPVDVRGFVDGMGRKFLLGTRSRAAVDVQADRHRHRHYKPPHLLGLLRFALVGRMPENEVKVSFRYDYDYDTAFEQSSSWSAMELAETGVMLTPSSASWFGDIAVRKGVGFCNLALSPVFLNHVTASCLVNMAALEATSTGGASNESADGFVVSSYLSVLAMLMDKMEDVEELRRRGLLQGPLSDMQALVFFKGLRHHLRFGDRHMLVLEQIKSYMRHRPVRVAVNRCVYNYYYQIVAGIVSITNTISSVCTVLQTFNKNGSK